VIAELSIRGFRSQLEEARNERDALIAELGYAVTHPGEVFENIGAEYAAKWQRFTALAQDPSLSGHSKPERIFSNTAGLPSIGTSPHLSN
jgi:hypothetical protein